MAHFRHPHESGNLGSVCIFRLFMQRSLGRIDPRNYVNAVTGQHTDAVVRHAHHSESNRRAVNSLYLTSRSSRSNRSENSSRLKRFERLELLERLEPNRGGLTHRTNTLGRSCPQPVNNRVYDRSSSALPMRDSSGPSTARIISVRTAPNSAKPRLPKPTATPMADVIQIPAAVVSP